jgi:hypothetical protein
MNTMAKRKDKKNKEGFENSKAVVRSHKSKDRHCNGQKKRDKKNQAVIYKTLHR